MAKAKQRYYTTKDIVVDGVPFQGGDELVDVPEGCFESMLRLGQVTEIPPEEWEGDPEPAEDHTETANTGTDAK